jgi:hypothetical protein
VGVRRRVFSAYLYFWTTGTFPSGVTVSSLGIRDHVWLGFFLRCDEHVAKKRKSLAPMPAGIRMITDDARPDDPYPSSIIGEQRPNVNTWIETG